MKKRLFLNIKAVFFILFTLISGNLHASSIASENPNELYRRELAIHESLAQERAVKFAHARADSIKVISGHHEIVEDLLSFFKVEFNFCQRAVQLFF